MYARFKKAMLEVLLTCLVTLTIGVLAVIAIYLGLKTQ